MAYVTTAQNNKSVTFSCMLNCFYFVLWARLAGRNVKNYEKLSFFSAFSCLDHFTQVSSQVKECLILQLHQTIRVLHVVMYPIAFILFYDRNWQGRVFKVMKVMKVLNIFIRFVLFLQVFVQVKQWIMLKLHKIK